MKPGCCCNRGHSLRNAIEDIRPKRILNSNLVKSRLSRTSISVVKSFWKFAQSTAVTIWQLSNLLWAKRFRVRCKYMIYIWSVSGGYTMLQHTPDWIALAAYVDKCANTGICGISLSPESRYRNYFCISRGSFADIAWRRHQMKTFFALLALCTGNSSVTGEFPSQRPVTRSFDVFFYLCLNKRLSKQSWHR